jgi:hypothetical protein
MLLETIKRYNGEKLIKQVSIDILKVKGKTLPQIHSVPALMIFPEKQLIFGKQVFDYLLLPKSGKLLQIQQNNEVNEVNEMSMNQQNQPHHSEKIDKEPASFSINSRGLSDNFAMIEDDNNINTSGLDDRSYNWTSLNMDDSNNIKPDLTDISVETRAKKSEYNLSELRSQRSLELEQTDLNKTQLPLSISPR